MSVLPKGWIEVTLGQITSKPQYGYTTKSQSGGSVRYLRTTDLTSGKINWESVPYCTENPADVAKYQLEDRDIVISRAGSVGFHSLIKSPPENVVFASYLIRFKPSSLVNERYLSRFLDSQAYWEQITEKAAGVAVQNVNAVKLADLRIPLAPINEQIRIADKLDSILAKVDRAQARLDKIPGILKRFRQSVLAAATSGELTREWREENNIDKNSWSKYSIAKLSERAFDGPFGSKLKTSDYTSHGVKVVRLENIGHLTFKADKETFISEVKYQDLVNNTVLHDDILFSSFVDEEIRTCLFDQTFGAAINKADCFCIRADRNKIQPRFLMYALGCRTTYQKIKMQVHGITRPRINLSFLKSLEIETPSHAEQAEIVVRVMELFTKADRIENKYLQTKTGLHLLTQSILAKAFRGELVLQDPEDESADKLFERLKTDKSGLKSKRK